MVIEMAKIQQCKGAADFLRIMWTNLYRPQCMRAEDKVECLTEVHLHFSEMVEIYAENTNLSDNQFNRCFAKPVNKILEEIASKYERLKPRQRSFWAKY